MNPKNPYEKSTPTFDKLFELDDYFIAPSQNKDEITYKEITKILEGKDIKTTLKKLFPEAIFQLLGPTKVPDDKSFYQLQMIVVPFKLRERGTASEFMHELVTLAKKENKDIFLTPDASYQEKGGMTKGHLTQWYKTFGFQKKKKSDFRAMATYCFYV